METKTLNSKHFYLFAWNSKQFYFGVYLKLDWLCKPQTVDGVDQSALDTIQQSVYWWLPVTWTKKNLRRLRHYIRKHLQNISSCFLQDFRLHFYVSHFHFEALSRKCIFITATKYSDHSFNLSIEQTTSVETPCILIVRYNQTGKSLNHDWERVIPQDHHSLSCGNSPR